jgi:hypothetical protein
LPPDVLRVGALAEDQLNEQFLVLSRLEEGRLVGAGHEPSRLVLPDAADQPTRLAGYVDARQGAVTCANAKRREAPPTSCRTHSGFHSAIAAESERALN